MMNIFFIVEFLSFEMLNSIKKIQTLIINEGIFMGKEENMILKNTEKNRLKSFQPSFIEFFFPS